MNNFNFFISCESYWKDVSKGFSSLQQDAEFVDMTLAADGHLVKVHQNIIALASPYLKTMLQLAPCQHPIIFLHNISKQVLGYILEYIYTGEVRIPSDTVNMFVNSCKSLYIRGIDTISVPKSVDTVEAESLNQRHDEIADKHIAAHIKINSHADNKYELEVVPNQDNFLIEGNEHEVSYTKNSDVPNEINNAMEIDSENIETVDIHNQTDSRLEPNTDPFTYMTVNTQNAKITDKVKIISNVKIIEPKTNKSSAIDINVNDKSVINLLEKPIEITLNTDNWQMNDMPNISFNEILKADSTNNDTFNVDEITARAIPSTSQVNIWQTEFDQNNTSADLSLMKVQDQFVDLIEAEVKEMENTCINVKKEVVLKNLKKIGSHIRSQNQMKNLPKMTLNQVDNYQKADQIPHYTISNRGALQMLFHRYLYHAHHHSHRGAKKRWRCIDYRKLHCPAFIDTENEEITNMSVDHIHANHDNIIRKKLKRSIVFTSLSNAVNTINTLVKDD